MSVQNIHGLSLRGECGALRLDGLAIPGLELCWPSGSRLLATFADAAGVETTLDCRGDDAWLSVTCRPGSRPGFVVFRLQVADGPGTLSALTFVVPRFKMPGEDVLVTTQTSGMRYERPGEALFRPLQARSVAWKDRTMWVVEDGLQPPEEEGADRRRHAFKASPPFVDYYSEHGGFYLAFHDPGFENTWFTLCAERGEAGIGLEARKELNRPLTAWSCDLVLGLHQGDWHAGADCYREFFASLGLGIRRSCRFTSGVSCHYDLLWQNGDIGHRFRDLPALSAQAAAEGFDTLLCASWNRGGFDTGYPDFRPAPELGSEAELQEAVRHIHQQGRRIIFYVNAYSYDRDSADFAASGQPAAVRTAEGRTVDVRWGSRVLTAMCNGAPAWRERVLQNIGYVTGTLGADGVYLDQLNVIPPVCTATGHQHDRSVIRQGVRLIAEARRRYGDDIILLSEWCNEAMATVLDAQLIQSCWRHQRHSWPEVFRYAFPGAACLDMILQKPWPGVDPAVEGRFVRQVFDRLLLDGILFWCYDHVSTTPGFATHFRYGMALSRAWAPLLAEAEFRDVADLAEVPAGIMARTFAGTDKLWLLAANRSGEPATLTLRDGRRFGISADPLSLTCIPPA